jgi:predicted aspartyl protease
MPVFSFTSSDLESNGAIIEVTIWPDFAIIKSLADKGEYVPRKKVVGLIDTGASCSAFDASIANELGLVVRDTQNVLTPSGESSQSLYDVVIVLADAERGISLQAFGANLGKQPYDILLGRDVLKSCTLVFNGWNDSYDLHFHQEKIKS